MQRSPIADIEFNEGFNNSKHSLDARLAGTSALGSSNNLILGDGYSKPHGGYSTKGANTGSRIMVQLGNDYGGIKDNGGTLGNGSFFQDIGKSLWSIGAGLPSIAGATISGVTLSSLLQVSIAVSGAYSSGNTYQVGLAQPSSPDVGIPSSIGGSYTGLINGTVTSKLVRLRPSTGDVSRASTTSAVVNPASRTIRVTFPAASTGQTHWAIFFTEQGFGGVGLHYRASYNGSLDIAESTVAAGTVDGIARSLEFDFQDGDLIDEAAEISYIDNYPPPAGTHAVRLENVMNVLGCYVDSVSSPTSTNPGTCIAVSLPNFYGSYKPRHLLFLPEQVVSVLSRPTDSYAWIGCRNSILTLQYTGVTDAPACTIATAFPNIGIAYHHNWAQFYGRLCIFTTKGSLVIMTEEGNLDETFAAPIKKFIKNWQPVDTIVGFDVETNSLVIGNGIVTLSYCLDNSKWSDPCYLMDAGVTGSVLSCVTSAGKLIVSVNNSGSRTAYDYNTGATQMPISKVSNWIKAQSAVSIYEMEAAINASKTNYPVAICIQRNLRHISSRGAGVASGLNLLSLTESIIDASSIGDSFFVYGTDIGGSGVHYLTGKIGAGSTGTLIAMKTAGGSDILAQATASNCFVLFGKYVKVVTPTLGEQHLANLSPLVQDSRSFAVGLWMMTDAVTGEFMQARLLGTGGASTVAARV